MLACQWFGAGWIDRRFNRWDSFGNWAMVLIKYQSHTFTAKCFQTYFFDSKDPPCKLTIKPNKCRWMQKGHVQLLNHKVEHVESWSHLKPFLCRRSGSVTADFRNSWDWNNLSDLEFQSAKSMTWKKNTLTLFFGLQTVWLFDCFSGKGRGKGLLLAIVSPVSNRSPFHKVRSNFQRKPSTSPTMSAFAATASLPPGLRWRHPLWWPVCQQCWPLLVRKQARNETSERHGEPGNKRNSPALPLVELEKCLTYVFYTWLIAVQKLVTIKKDV